jgi:Asp-tRNA(Asn)/Glu-tRNA(Gln) amidotransferase A subunit family amidase
MTAVEPGTDAPAGPLAPLLARRIFLGRLAAVTAAAAAGPALWQGPAGAAPAPVRTAAASAYGTGEVPADLVELTIAGAAGLIRSGALDPVDLVEAHLARIAAYDGIYSAFNTVRAEEAVAEAKALGSGRHRGPLHGIPLAIKDNYYTAGTRTTASSFIFWDFVPPFDATTVARLKAAGAIVIGKTQMGPLATSRATTPAGDITTVNAWTPADDEVNPGGSSTGSATAVAARLATSSTGTQTGGSITGPANAQGLTGLKPTMGRASLYGIVPLTYTRDHPGPIARDALDAAIMLEAMAGPDPNDLRTLGLPPVPDLVTAATPVRRRGVSARWPTRIGVLPGYRSAEGPEGPARAAMLDALADVPGMAVVEVPLPDEWELLTGSAFNNVRLPERSEPFLPFLKQDLKLFGVSLNSWVNGLFLGADEYVRGQRAKGLLLERIFDQVFSVCDVVVQTSPVPFDIVGLPEIAFPIGFGAPAPDRPSVPLGAILGGLPYQEDRLLSVVAAYQAVTEWHLRRPPEPVPQPPEGAAAGAVAAASVAAPAPRRRLAPEEVEAAGQ